MTVYVDDVRHLYGRMVMCHMWADDLDELLAMASRIGVQLRWLQGHPQLSLPKYRNPSWVHFDISLGKKEEALRAGAVLTDRYGPIEHLAKRDIASGDPDRIALGASKLKSIAAIRSREAFRRNLPNPSAETAPAGEAGSFHSTAGAEELRGAS